MLIVTQVTAKQPYLKQTRTVHAQSVNLQLLVL